MTGEVDSVAVHQERSVKRMDEIYDRLRELFSPHRLGDAIAGVVPDIAAALAAFIALYVLYRLVDRGLRAALERSELDLTARAFIRTVLRYAMVTIALVTALAQVGVDVSSLLTSLGVAGLTIGFAAKDVLSNVISGIFIFWDRPFVVGDLVEVGGQYGRVDEITMRSTRVVTVDGKMLAVPNSEIVSKTVTSYTNFPQLRIDVDFTIAVTEDLAEARRIALGIIAADDERFRAGSATVVVTALNDYNVAMQLRVWLIDERQHIPVRFELREKLFEALRAGDIDMPYETFELHTKAA